MIEHKLLLRQLKRELQIHSFSELDTFLNEQVQTPQARTQLKKLLLRINESYTQFDRDLELRSRSLELSSSELTASNQRLREEAQAQQRILTHLRATANTLLRGAGLKDLEAQHDDIEAITALMRHLVSEREQAILDLVNARDAAEAANRAKSDFLANMSHEIRTPMNGILGMTDLALSTQLSDQQREFLSLVKSSANGLLVIIDDILDFSKIEAGKLTFETLHFPLKAMLSEVTGPLELKARQKGLSFSLHMDADLPPLIKGDPGRLRQVLINLLGNAIKFTRQGGEISLSVTLPPAKGEIRFAVKDTGIGIPLAQQQLIFKAFSQADTSTTRRYGGSGLGLAISSRLIALMGSYIHVQSAPDQGSEFSFILPDAITTTSFIPPTREACTNAPETPIKRPLRILLAEDNLVNQKVATLLLRQQGHQVEIANDGAEALAMQQNSQFDLVLMDVQMPRMSGLEATIEIRKADLARQRPHQSIIALTAHAMAGDTQRCMDAGMDGYLSKPINIDRLMAKIRNICFQSDGLSSPVEPAHQEPIRMDEPASACSPTRNLFRQLDLERLDKTLGGDLDMIEQLCCIFLDTQPHDWQRLQQTIASPDRTKIYSIAHKLTGSISTLAQSQLIHKFQVLTRAAAEENDPEMQRLTTEIQPEFEQLLAELREFIGR